MRLKLTALGAAAIGAVVLAFTVISLASAHATVTTIVWDNPNSPTTLTATALEHISNTPGTYSLKVYNSSNAEVDLGNTTINASDTTKMSVSVTPGLPGGIYHVAWQTLSADDGHAASGTLYISVGTDPDFDGVPNGSDNCPWWPNPSQTSPPWTVPAGDSDCDGYPDTTNASGRASETFVGTDPSRHCASTSTANDEPLPDAWPMDFNDDQRANLSDVLSFVPSFNSNVTTPNYDKRHDVTGDGVINLSDVLRFSEVFNKQCSA